MGFLTYLKNKGGILGELLKFFWQRKIWWLIPIILILIFLVAVLAIESAAGIAPFIYTFI